MDIKHKLILNKHPKDNEDMCLIDARGMKVSIDLSCISNEDGLGLISEIHDVLFAAYTKYNIVGVIPCNNEVVIIASSDAYGKYTIYRYLEEDKSVHAVYDNYKYNGGVISGTYTYNVESALIIAIAEDCKEQDLFIPLKTINLGKIDDDSVPDDTDLPDGLLSLSPELTIPSVDDLSYIDGSWYKGWTYMFIRYKINESDYTQWFSLGVPVYVDSLVEQTIIKAIYRQKVRANTIRETGNSSHSEENIDFIYNRELQGDGYCVGATDSFSDTSDISSVTFKFSINDLDTNYKQYQIGFSCSSKSYTKGFVSADIKIEVDSFSADISTLSEYGVDNFILENYNYYNVENVINYNNRLYISNYEEVSPNIVNDDILDAVNNTSLSLFTNIERRYLHKNIVMANDSYVKGASALQYKIPVNEYLTFTEFFNVNGDTTFIVEPTGSSQVGGISTYADQFVIGSIYKPGEIYISTKSDIEKGKTPFLYGKEVRIYSDSYDIDIILDLTKIGIAGDNYYIDVTYDFNDRIHKDKTLIPDGVYNFYIHYVDKYGHSTNGYKIENKLTVSDNIIPFIYKEQELYAMFDSDMQVKDIKYNDYDVYKDRIRVAKIVATADIQQAFENAIYPIIEDEYLKELNINQIFNNATNIGDFGYYINSKGDKLFRIPNINYNIDYKDQKDTNNIYSYEYRHSIQVESVKIPNGYVGYFISYEKYETMSRYTGFLSKSDFRVQSVVRDENDEVIWSRGNFMRLNGTTEGNDLIASCDSSNFRIGSNMHFYSSKFDIDDSIKLDFNIMTINYKNCMNNHELKGYDYWQRNAFVDKPYDCNKPAGNKNGVSIDLSSSYLCPKSTLAPADSIKDGRSGKGTSLVLKDSYNLFNVDDPTKDAYHEIDKDIEEVINSYIVTLKNITGDLYVNDNKELIKLSEVIYDETSRNIKGNYNGFRTNEGVIIYNDEGVRFDTSNYEVFKSSGSRQQYYPNDITLTEDNYPNSGDPDTNVDGKADGVGHSFRWNVPFFNYLQFPIIDTYPYESKSFNNTPASYVYPTRFADEDADGSQLDVAYVDGVMVEPKNSIDLFENRIGAEDNYSIKVFANYRDDIVNATKYDKTVRRSNILQDESRENAWRNFPLEGYKNISENKGNIVKILASGLIFIIHTEHSMFILDREAALKTVDANVQLEQQDTFDVDYQEVMTSQLGYGGIQDKQHGIIDQFGYIYYNRDDHTLFKYDNNSLAIIDEDITMWLNKYKPYNVEFLHDKDNSRLIIQFDFTIFVANEDGTQSSKNMTETVSYHYNTNNFISLHDYVFNRGFNTKNNTYILSNDTNKLFEYKRDTLYGVIPADLHNPNISYITNDNGRSYYTNAYFTVMLNREYDTIKFLEYIEYVLRKIPKSLDYNYNAVETEESEYSGDKLRVFSKSTDTKIIDIRIDTLNEFNKYQKPYYENGRWKHNYFRNLIASEVYGGDDALSRIFGEYINFTFTLDNEDKELVEFEDLSISVTKNRRT